MWQLDKLKETLRFEKEGTRPEIGAARFGLSGFLKCAKPGLFFAHYRRFPHTMTNKVQNLKHGIRTRDRAFCQFFWQK